MKRITTQLRHGDVILTRCKDQEGEPTALAVLAEGEATGHAHRLRPGEGGTIALVERGGARYAIVVDEDATLDHEEHGAVAIAPGTYEVRIQRTYDYLSEMERKVID